MRELITALMLWIGSGFVLLAAIGLLRLPDFFTRMHSGAKAGSVGIAFLAVGVAVFFSSLEVTFQAVLIILFFLLTAPVAMHMIGRAAYLSGVPLWEETVCDDLAEALKQEENRKEPPDETEPDAQP
jgi:multicomponent Na+:H+ antiporter subunit G